MPVTRGLLLALAVFASSSCKAEPGPPPGAKVLFVVESDPGFRLGAVSIYLDGRLLGQTNSAGFLQTDIPIRSGSPLRLEHDCPIGHEAPSETKLLRLRPFDRLDAPDPGPLQITLRCRPKQRRAVFIVRAKGGAALPVLLDGELVAQTNSLGIAHFSTSAPPGTDFIVRVDTSARPELRPKAPSHLRALEDSDQIFLIEQAFQSRREPRRKGAPRKRITKIE